MGRICVKLPTRECILAADSMVHFSFFFPLPLLLKNLSCDFRVRFHISPSCLPSFDSVAGIPCVVFPGTLISEFVVGFLVKLVKFNLSLTPSSFGRGTGGQSLSHRTSHIVLVLVPILDHEWTGR